MGTRNLDAKLALLDEAERRHQAAVAAKGLDPEVPLLGLGGYAFGDSLPPAAFGRAHFVCAVTREFPACADDALDRLVALVGRHADYLLFRTNEQRRRFGRRLGTPPAKKPDANRKRVRLLHRAMADWGIEFDLRHNPSMLRETVAMLEDHAAMWRLGCPGHMEVPVALFYNVAGAIASYGPTPGPSPRWPALVPAFYLFMGIAAPYGIERAFPEPHACPVSVALPPWRPDLESESQYRDRVREALDSQLTHSLRQHADAVAGQAERVPTKHTREHFRWLAQYQVGKKSLRAVAREACREPKTVSTALRETAALIGLPLRPPNRPGRPRKAS